MNSYGVCASCARHVKRADAACPFCGACLRLLWEPAERGARRASRAEWLAYGGSALAILGCTSGHAAPSTTNPDGAAIPDAALDTTTAEADSETDAEPLDADATDAPSFVLPNCGALVDAAMNGPPVPADAGFMCASHSTLPGNDADVPDMQICNPATEWCFTNHDFNPTGCVPFTSKVGLPMTPCIQVIDWDAAACGGDVPRCSCVVVTCFAGECTEDDAGAMTVSCGSCYGAPPARLERLEA